MTRTRTQRIRLGLLCAVLAVLIGALAAVGIDQHLLRTELKGVVQAKENLLTEGAFVATEHELESTAAVSRPYVLFGEPSARVAVYAQSARSQDGEAHYTEYSFHFARQDGEWVELDSGVCRGAECQERAEDAFGN